MMSELEMLTRIDELEQRKAKLNQELKSLLKQTQCYTRLLETANKIHVKLDKNVREQSDTYMTQYKAKRDEVKAINVELNGLQQQAASIRKEHRAIRAYNEAYTRKIRYAQAKRDQRAAFEKCDEWNRNLFDDEKTKNVDCVTE